MLDREGTMHDDVGIVKLPASIACLHRGESRNDIFGHAQIHYHHVIGLVAQW